MSLASTIENSLWAALERHARPMFGTPSKVVPATGPGMPVMISGYFFIGQVAADIAAAVKATHSKELS